MNVRHLTHATALCFVLALTATAGAAPQDADGRLFDVKFEGGTLTEYVAALDESAGDVNILVAEEARDMDIPALTLHSVDLDAAVFLLHSVTNPTEGGRVRKLKVDRVPISGSPKSIYTITATHQFERSLPLQTTVISIARLTARGMDPEHLLTAIETALELAAPDGPTVTLKFHEATSLLIARGTPPQLGVIDNVVSEASESLKFRMSLKEQEDQAQALAMAQNQIAALQAQLDQALAEIAEMTQRLVMLQERGAGGER